MTFLFIWVYQTIIGGKPWKTPNPGRTNHDYLQVNQPEHPRQFCTALQTKHRWDSQSRMETEHLTNFRDYWTWMEKLGQKAEQAAQRPQQDSISPSSSPVSKYLPTIEAHTHRLTYRLAFPNDATPHSGTLDSTTLNYTTPHYIYTTLCSTTLHYTTLHSATLHYTPLHYTTLHYTEWHCTTDRQVDG